MRSKSSNEASDSLKCNDGPSTALLIMEVKARSLRYMMIKIQIQQREPQMDESKTRKIKS